MRYIVAQRNQPTSKEDDTEKGEDREKKKRLERAGKSAWLPSTLLDARAGFFHTL